MTRKHIEAVRANPSLQELLDSGTLRGAARRNKEQIARQKSDRAQSYFELGTIEELRFDWPKALKSTVRRGGWTEGRSMALDLLFRTKQNRFAEAISVYKVLSGMYVEDADVADTLNKLATLYRNTQRMQEAEVAYGRHCQFRRLAAVDFEAYLLDIEGTLNNLATLYHATQRMREAAAAYKAAMSTYCGLAAINLKVDLRLWRRH